MLLQEDIIKGERFQQLADVYIGYQEDFHFNPLIARETHKHININNIVSEYDNPRVVFCYSHNIGVFSHIIKHFKNPFVLITHNSDGIVEYNDSTKCILETHNLKSWYAQNLTICHEKLFALPIGMANNQWAHGVTTSVIKHLNEKKTKKVYFNFNISTNYWKRQECFNSLAHKLIGEPTVSPENYHAILSQYEFCICPEGNGVDTHRLWEALYLKCIPIVIQSPHIDILKNQLNIPMVILNSWDEFDISKLNYNDYNIENNIDYYTPLKMDFYVNKILSDKDKL